MNILFKEFHSECSKMVWNKRNTKTPINAIYVGRPTNTCII